MPDALAGANLSNAMLPENLSVEKGLNIANDASKHAQKLFFMLLLASFYIVLTIGATTDPALLTNSNSSPLPLIGVAVPIVGFYYAAPSILFIMYAYFLLYMQLLWEKLAKYPAVFQNGKPLDSTIHQWLLNGLIRTYFKQLKQDRTISHRILMILSLCTAWLVVPAILAASWYRCLFRQDALLTSVHVVLLLLSFFVGFSMFMLMYGALMHQSTKSPWWKNPKLYASSLFILLASIGIICLSGWATTGGAHADFHEADVSIKPANWTGKEDAALVKGAQLKGANLIGVDAEKAFLINADLRGANLKEGTLAGADLRGADLSTSQGLTEAQLKNAKIDNTTKLPPSLQHLIPKEEQKQAAPKEEKKQADPKKEQKQTKAK